VTAPDPQPFDVVDANAADVETLFEIYLDVVAAGGADPAGGEAIRDVFVEGWIRRRRVYAARRDGATVGATSCAATSRPWPGRSPRPATWSPGPNEAAASAPGCWLTPSRRPHATATAP